MFDQNGGETARHWLPDHCDGVWHGYLPSCRPGQAYGYRVHGRWAPLEGLRFNPAKLLIDPYARQLSGSFAWNPAVFDFDPDKPEPEPRINTLDSAPYVPRSVVRAASGPLRPGPRIPWSETLLYETNLRGYTMAHPQVPALARGKFAGMRNKHVLAYIKSLGITAIELLPVQAFIDEQHLHEKGLRNFWGYNSINFFAPEARLGHTDPVAEFRDMANAIHDAGLELILDVVFNHTGESGSTGPSLSFRGIDNLARRVDGCNLHAGAETGIEAQHGFLRVAQTVIVGILVNGDNMGRDIGERLADPQLVDPQGAPILTGDANAVEVEIGALHGGGRG